MNIKLIELHLEKISQKSSMIFLLNMATPIIFSPFFHKKSDGAWFMQFLVLLAFLYGWYIFFLMATCSPSGTGTVADCLDKAKKLKGFTSVYFVVMAISGASFAEINRDIFDWVGIVYAAGLFYLMYFIHVHTEKINEADRMLDSDNDS